METARVNEVLGEQIAIIRASANAMEPKDLPGLAEKLDEIEVAIGVLREYLSYLPK